MITVNMSSLYDQGVTVQLEDQPQESPVTVYLPTWNHLVILGIVDICNVLKKGLSGHGIDLQIVEKPQPNGVNLIIEEFSRNSIIKQIKKTKRSHPQTCFVVLLTEFVTKTQIEGRTVYSFNLFEGDMDNISRWLLHGCALTYPKFMQVIYCSMISAIVTAGRIKIGLGLGILRRLQKCLIYLDKLISRLISYMGASIKKEGNFDFKKFYYILYMRKRYAGLWRVYKYLDGMISLHPSISIQVNELLDVHTPSFYPLLNAKSPVFSDDYVNKPPKAVLSGALTEHRNLLFERLRETLKSAGLSADAACIWGFDAEKKLRGVAEPHMFSLHFPQTENWPYSSPMRVARSYERGEIPVVARRTGDHQSEMATVLMDPANTTDVRRLFGGDKKTIENLRKNLREQVEEYNRIALEANTEVSELFRKLRKSVLAL